MRFLKLFTLPRIIFYFTILVIVLFLFGLFLPIQPVIVKSITTEKATYTTGDEVVYTVNRCRNIDGSIDGTTFRALVPQNAPSSESTVLSISPSTDGSRGCGLVERNFFIPSEVPPGKYKLEIMTSYNVFILRPPVKNTYFSNTFTIEGNK